MTIGSYWENESKERKEYITKWFNRALGIKRTDDFEKYKEKLNTLLKKNKDELTGEQKDLLSYYYGEKNKKLLREDIFKDIKNIDDIEFKDKLIKKKTEFENYKTDKYYYIQEKGKDYKIAKYSNGEKKKTIAFMKDMRVWARIESYETKKGITKLRFRDLKSGKLVSGVPKKEYIGKIRKDDRK